MKQGWSKEQIARAEKVFDEIWERSERVNAEIAMSRKSMVLLLNQGPGYVGSRKTLRVIEWNTKYAAYDTVRIPLSRRLSKTTWRSGRGARSDARRVVRAVLLELPGL